MSDYPKMDYIGALWSKVAKSGREYLSGEITIGDQKLLIRVFPNTRKYNDNHPDYNIVGTGEGVVNRQRQPIEPKGSIKPMPVQEQSDEQPDDDLPF